MGPDLSHSVLYLFRLGFASFFLEMVSSYGKTNSIPLCAPFLLYRSGSEYVSSGERGGYLSSVFLQKGIVASIPHSGHRALYRKSIRFFFYIFSWNLRFDVFRHQGRKQRFLFIVSSLAIVGIFLSLIAVRFLNETIVSILSRIAGLFGKKEWFDHKLAHYVRDLGNFLVLKRFILPAFLTSLTWLIGYALSYGILLKLVGIPMNYSGIVLIMFAGAVGVMIPSAPSGAGVFHASVTSSFVLMGRKASEGLFYATTVHLAQFILQSVFAVILYLYWIVDRKKRGLGKAEFSLKESEVIEVEAAE